jgi:phytoene dehydrogenase-like protein
LACIATSLFIADRSTIEVELEGDDSQIWESFQEADVLACNTHPRIMSQQQCENEADLPEDFRQSMSHYQSESASFRMNVALSRLPRFTAHPEYGPHHSSGIILSPSLQRMWIKPIGMRLTKARASVLIVGMLIPSTVDETLAPVGPPCCQLVLPALSTRAAPGGVQWDEAQKQTAVASIFQVIEALAPWFLSSQFSAALPTHRLI